MIIQDNRTKKGKIWLKHRSTAVVTLVIVAVLALLIQLFYRPRTTNAVISCDMERVKGDYFSEGGTQLTGGSSQSNLYFRSGRYSSKISTGKDLQYGFSYQLSHFKPGEYYKASVWRYRPKQGSGSLVVSMDPDKAYYRETNTMVSKTEDGWELLELYFSIPYHQVVEVVKVYVYSDGLQDIFFDDFTLEKISYPEGKTFKPAALNIELKEEAYQKLSQKRKEAIATGILSSEDKDFVNANLIPVGTKEKIPVNIRLKGDWLDHLQGNKWSFRINAKDPFTWNRLVSFSIHTPQARDFLKEWVFHRFLETEDVLTTRYDFLEVNLNGKPLGVYAWEEHFEKQIIEYHHRREGPVLKFNEEGFWANIKRQMFYLDGINPDNETYVSRPENSDIQAFGEKDIQSNPVLKRNLEAATDLMYQFRNKSKSPALIFDLPLMAKYFAACDAFGAYHGIAWHNLRFYYNPVTNLLEPIGFDGFSGDELSHPALLGQGAGNPQKIKTGELFNLLFSDSDFLKLYLFYVEKYTSRDFLRDFYQKNIVEIRERELFLRKEFQDYTFNEDQMIERAQYAYALLFPYNDLSVKAFVKSASQKGTRLLISNTHSLPLIVTGYGFNAKEISMPLTKPVFLPGAIPREVILEQKLSGGNFDFSTATTNKMMYEAAPPAYVAMEAPSGAKFVFFQLPGLPGIYHSAIRTFPAPDGVLPEQELITGNLKKGVAAYTIRDTLILFHSGNFVLTESVVVPSGYAVRFEAGAKIDFVKGAFFLSYSPVSIFGQPEKPVQITSSDGTAKGFNIIKAGKVIFKEVVFKGFTNFSYQNWQLTGAVNIYQTQVEMNRVVVSNNHCEDALNIIRSEFNISQLNIHHTFADGFDSDFCKGVLTNSIFSNTGNDCLDFSGSVVQIRKCSFENPGDKGISIGEESSAVIKDVNIKGAQIAIASKDLSVIMAEDVSLENCIQGFAGYQKKPEYGSSTTIVKSYSAVNVKKLVSMAAGCTIQIDGKLQKF